jgi:lysophospholipase L1-like esterase
MRAWRFTSASLVLSAVALVSWALPAAATAAPSYVALGDSYSSGVGTRVYYNDGTSCQRSPDAYGPKISAARGYSLTFEACSGAKSTDVNANQLGPLSSTTNLVTITIGGNDAGFSNVILNCAAYYFRCQSAINTANSFIQNQLPALLDTTYGDIRSRASHAHVVVLGYPHLFTSSGTTCNFNTLTSSHEKELNQTADLLDGVTAGRAAAHGFTYVDPRNAFGPHEVCSSSEWLNGQSNPLSESYHPNVSGQAEFTTLVEGVLP